MQNHLMKPRSCWDDDSVLQEDGGLQKHLPVGLLRPQLLCG